MMGFKGFFLVSCIFLASASNALQLNPKTRGGGSRPSPLHYRRLEEHESPPSVQEAGEVKKTPYANLPYLKQPSKSPIAFAIKKKKKTPKAFKVSNIHQLRQAVLDEGAELKQVNLTPSFVGVRIEDVLNHDVLLLIAERFHSESQPGSRKDNSKLALAMEGGGMRGCVSAGMAAAIASLGLCDVFDTIYGSSAGSVIGSYMVSRQMCVDVYVDILPAAKKEFVCKRRLVKSLAVSLVDLMVAGFDKSSRKSSSSVSARAVTNIKPQRTPGMNISFILDGIMGEDHGVRPLDFEMFQRNNEKQHLRVAASCVRNGTLFSKCFGTEDFFDDKMAAKRADGTRQGLFACLEASMTVPGATGPPVEMIAEDGEVIPYFDAFCFEPLPYRSAVDEGATHVLVLCSRPEGFEPATKPGVYEQGVAPLYFHTHKQPQVAEFFEQGGQQYIYAEDLLTLEEGKFNTDTDGVLVPPPKILYGTKLNEETQQLSREREALWNRAHLLPIKVPRGTPELPTLKTDKDAVLAAVRGGFSAAFDLLAPAIGLELGLTGEQAAKLVFPNDSDSASGVDLSQQILQTKVRVTGDAIGDYSVREPRASITNIEDILHGLGVATGIDGAPTMARLSQMAFLGQEVESAIHSATSNHNGMEMNAENLLTILPGFREGKLDYLAKGLRSTNNNKSNEVVR
jgi:predicted patatin/cPLA2 family phospholipase